MRFLVIVGLVGILAAAVVPLAGAGGAVTRTFSAPVDRVWAATEGVLRHFGWELDKVDRSIGYITTDSRRVEGEDYGVYAKGTRHRLRVNVKAAGEGRTTVSVERFVFKRERILWMDNDEPLTATDQDVERGLLDAIGKAL